MTDIKFGSVYQHNRVKVRQMVPKKLSTKNGRAIVIADSCTSLFKLEIPVDDIHNEPARDGWSLVSGGGSNGGGPKR